MITMPAKARRATRSLSAYCDCRVSWLIATPAPTSTKRTSRLSAAIRLICQRLLTWAFQASSGVERTV